MDWLRAREMAGKGFLVGFDASDGLIEGMRAGHIHGLVVQDPVAMGELGVKTALAVLRGEKVETLVDTGDGAKSRGWLGRARELERRMVRAWAAGY